MKKEKLQNQNAILRKIGKRLRKYWFFLFLSLATAAVTVVLTLYVPILVGRIVDQILGVNEVHFQKIMEILLRIAVAVGFTALAQWLMNLCNNKLTYHVTRDLRNEAMEKVEILPLRYLDDHSYGDLVSRVIADVDQFADGLLLGFTQLFTGVMTILGTLLFMLTIDLKTTFVVVLVTPLSFFVAGFIAKHSYRMFRQQTLARGEETALIDEMMEGQKVVQAYCHEEEAMRKFDEINTRLNTCSMKATFYSSLTNPATRFVNALVYAGVAGSGAVSVIHGGISVGQLVSFLSYANQYTKPFNEISGVITELQNAIACAGRILELIEEEPEVPDRPQAVELKNPDGTVTLENVDFSYTPEIPLIRNFNLQVQKGQRIAIVGPTGCGKTTLINLLMRFYDVDAGAVRVSNMDIRDMTRHSLRAGYGMVLQDTWIKTGTIRDNICMGRPDATEEEMLAASKASYAHNFIRRMPKGYDTWITEENCGLSQGQKQLLCIARVMLVQPPMLILDEATSSIDTRTELKIQDAFAKLMEGRTSFIVAHRLSTIQSADLILVMKDGHVIEQGRHEDLLKQQGFYAHLYNSQFAQ